MKERHQPMERAKRVSTTDVASVTHHYVNPDASHFEEPSSTRMLKKEDERKVARFLAEKNPHN